MVWPVHGRAGDVAALNTDEVARLRDELNPPPHLYSLSTRYLKQRQAARD